MKKAAQCDELWFENRSPGHIVARWQTTNPVEFEGSRADQKLRRVLSQCLNRGLALSFQEQWWALH
jgi:hypothetical protein